MNTIVREAEQPLPVSVHSGKAELRQAICHAAVSVLSSEYRDALDAIVLTGSMARDEATCLWNGKLWTILGDAEFLLLLGKNRRPSEVDLPGVRQKIESLLRPQRIQCSIDLGLVPPDYFQRLPPHIFSFELKSCGKQVFGQTDVLSQIPSFLSAQISKEDAWRLLCNRLVELLEYSDDLWVSDTKQTERLRYKLVKLYLDMATSFLVFKEHYAPTYAERCANMLSLAERAAGTNGPNIDLVEFVKLVSFCTQAKLNPTEVGPDAPMLAGREAIRTAQSIWRWELQSLTGSSGSMSDSDLMREISSRQSLTQRLRGWAFAGREIGLVRSLRALPRWLWLATKSSPRNLIYSVGTTLLFDFTKSTGWKHNPNQCDLGSLAQLLPIQSFAEQKSSTFDWTDLARAVFQNYERFVLKTRA